MSSYIEAGLQSWSVPLPLTLAIALTALVYLRGWVRLRSAAEVLPAWRAASFLTGLFLIWLAIGSPLAAFDEQLLTAHMTQHLLLMTLAPPLLWLGAPVMPFLHGLPRRFVQGALGPVLRWPAIQRLGRVLAQPAFCLALYTAALVGWHIPPVFTLALHSEAWHVVEHVSFLAAGLLFWWPVVQPWPSNPTYSQWTILLYLFLATLPCDVLSGFLVFSERIVYGAYLSTGRPLTLPVLEDQELAGALMWTCVTIVYLIPAAIVSTRLLAPRSAGSEIALGTTRSGAV